MKKYLIIALIPLLFFGCKKRELTIEKLDITSESVVKSTNSIKISASYTYVTALKSVMGYVSRNSDMSNASSANATVNGNQFVVNFENLSENTLYYYCFECNNGVDIIKTDVKSVQTDFPGLIKGEFSVSATQIVSFSQGNLQYRASTDTWRFADNQFACIGENNSNISSTYDGWIDMFGWGTGDNPTNSSTDNVDYPAFTDWGSKPISNGGNAANLWRTLTKDEWAYVFNERSTSSGIRFVKAIVDGTWGVVLLPDDWDSALYNLNSPNVGTADFPENEISLTDWNSIFEANGAVFLPSAGWREGTAMNLVGFRGLYWSATNNSGVGAYNLYFLSDDIYVTDSRGRYIGQSVRLVCDIEN